MEAVSSLANSPRCKSRQQATVAVLVSCLCCRAALLRRRGGLQQLRPQPTLWEPSRLPSCYSAQLLPGSQRWGLGLQMRPESALARAESTAPGAHRQSSQQLSPAPAQLHPPVPPGRSCQQLLGVVQHYEGPRKVAGRRDWQELSTAQAAWPGRLPQRKLQSALQKPSSACSSCSAQLLSVLHSCNRAWARRVACTGKELSIAPLRPAASTFLLLSCSTASRAPCCCKTCPLCSCTMAHGCQPRLDDEHWKQSSAGSLPILHLAAGIAGDLVMQDSSSDTTWSCSRLDSFLSSLAQNLAPPGSTARAPTCKPAARHHLQSGEVTSCQHKIGTAQPCTVNLAAVALHVHLTSTARLVAEAHPGTDRISSASCS